MENSPKDANTLSSQSTERLYRFPQCVRIEAKRTIFLGSDLKMTACDRKTYGYPERSKADTQERRHCVHTNHFHNPYVIHATGQRCPSCHRPLWPLDTDVT